MKKIKAMLMVGMIVFSALAFVVPVIAPNGTVVSIEDVSIGPTESKTVPIMIENVEGVVVATVNLTYNPSVVHVTGVGDSEFVDFCGDTTDNTIGFSRISVMNYTVEGLTGDIRLANVTLEAVGSAEDWCYLNLTVEELKKSGEISIEATVDNGRFTIQEEDITAPIVKNPRANPLISPEDTDNEPLWGELAELMVNATDESGIADITITVNLSSVGKEVKAMNNIGNFTDAYGTQWAIFNCTTNASIGTAGWNGTSGAYEPYYLEVNASDIYGNSNTSVSIELMVMENGDVSENGEVTMYDSYYLAMWWLDKTGFEEIVEEVADVSGNSEVTMYDSYYLAMWWLDKTGFEKLK